MKTKVQELQNNEIVLLGAILTVVLTITSANGDFDWWDIVAGFIAFGFLSAFCKPNSTSRWAITVYNLALSLSITIIIAFPLYAIIAFLLLKAESLRCLITDNKPLNCLAATMWLNGLLIIVFLVILGYIFSRQ